MLILSYLHRNIWRNPLRVLMTGLAVGLPISIFVLSVAVVDGINRFLDNSARQLRLAITHKSSIVYPLPAGYRGKIEALDHSRPITVCGMRWIGGKVEDKPQPLSTLAADPDTFPAAFPEYLTDPAERAAWDRDRQAIVVGRGTAEQFGWRVGDRITIRASVPPYSAIPFHVVSTAQDVVDPVTLFCRGDYLEEEVKRQGYPEGLVSFFFAKCRSPDDLEFYRTAIDAHFANTPDPTLTQDEKAFMSQFIAQQFDLPRNLTILSVLTVVVAIIAAANTMSMNFRDRLAEYAALKALGFGRTLVFALIQFESLAICVSAGALGALGPWYAFTFTALRRFTVPLIQTLDVRLTVCMQAVGIAAAVGLIAAAWPVWLATRLRPVVAFRALE